LADLGKSDSFGLQKKSKTISEKVLFEILRRVFKMGKKRCRDNLKVTKIELKSFCNPELIDNLQIFQNSPKINSPYITPYKFSGSFAKPKNTTFRNGTCSDVW
jgi:hypothetical protein